MTLKRIHLHWTAGADGVNAVEQDAYHFLVGRDGKVYTGQDAPEANLSPIRGPYAAHTLNANSDAIGVALDAMAGARERPFYAGPYPITTVQITALVMLVANLCRKYGIPVTRETVLSHAEVERTLGINQRAKWDITWLPGMDGPRDAIEVGDILRAAIAAELAALDDDAAEPPPLAFGSEGPRVREVQVILRGLDLYRLDLDGKWGNGTETALATLREKSARLAQLIAGV